VSYRRIIIQQIEWIRYCPWAVDGGDLEHVPHSHFTFPRSFAPCCPPPTAAGEKSSRSLNFAILKECETWLKPRPIWQEQKECALLPLYAEPASDQEPARSIAAFSKSRRACSGVMRSSSAARQEIFALMNGAPAIVGQPSVIRARASNGPATSRRAKLGSATTTGFSQFPVTIGSSFINPDIGSYPEYLLSNATYVYVRFRTKLLRCCEICAGHKTSVSARSSEMALIHFRRIVVQIPFLDRFLAWRCLVRRGVLRSGDHRGLGACDTSGLRIRLRLGVLSASASGLPISISFRFAGVCHFLP